MAHSKESNINQKKRRNAKWRPNPNRAGHGRERAEKPEEKKNK
jgi:hypothetical protein